MLILVFFSTSCVVLRFEPSNPTAREFYPVLVEKIRIGELLMSKAVPMTLFTTVHEHTKWMSHCAMAIYTVLYLCVGWVGVGGNVGGWGWVGMGVWVVGWGECSTIT